MTLQPGDLLAITRPAGPQAGTYQLQAAAMADLLSPPPVLAITGQLWSSVRSPADNSWQAICWAAELGLLVGVSSSGKGNRVMTSPDGINWTSRSSAADNAWTSLCWAPERELLVAVSSSGTGNRIMTSADGLSWTVGSSPADLGWRSLCWSPQHRRFAAVSNSGAGNRVMVSP